MSSSLTAPPPPTSSSGSNTRHLRDFWNRQFGGKGLTEEDEVKNGDAEEQGGNDGEGENEGEEGGEGDEEDWLVTFDDILDTGVFNYVKKEDRILIVGCGLSTLGVDLYRRGFTSIVCSDIAETAIAIMKERHQAIPEIRWEVHDVTNMKPCVDDASFDVVIDKFTSDTLQFRCKHKDRQRLVRTMWHEMYRVLSVQGGVFISVTPRKSLKFLYEPEWQVMPRLMIAKKEGLHVPREGGYNEKKYKRDRVYVHSCIKRAALYPAPSRMPTVTDPNISLLLPSMSKTSAYECVMLDDIAVARSIAVQCAREEEDHEGEEHLAAAGRLRSSHNHIHATSLKYTCWTPFVAFRSLGRSLPEFCPRQLAAIERRAKHRLEGLPCNSGTKYEEETAPGLPLLQMKGTVVNKIKFSKFMYVFVLQVDMGGDEEVVGASGDSGGEGEGQEDNTGTERNSRSLEASFYWCDPSSVPNWMIQGQPRVVTREGVEKRYKLVPSPAFNSAGQQVLRPLVNVVCSFDVFDSHQLQSSPLWTTVSLFSSHNTGMQYLREKRTHVAVISPEARRQYGDRNAEKEKINKEEVVLAQSVTNASNTPSIAVGCGPAAVGLCGYLGEAGPTYVADDRPPPSDPSLIDGKHVPRELSDFIVLQELFRKGDRVNIKGFAFRTKTGFPSLYMQHMSLLAIGGKPPSFKDLRQKKLEDQAKRTLRTGRKEKNKEKEMLVKERPRSQLQPQ